MKIVEANPTDLEFIVPLRLKVLHPEGPLSRVTYKKDHHSETLHLVVRSGCGSQVLACGTLIPESELEEYSVSNLRVRGMAVESALRGKGLGTQMLKKFLKEAKKRRAKKMWCNARIEALPLYQRQGFVKVGESFDVPGSGPHYRMILKL